MKVLSGKCVGGPRDGQSLASMQGVANLKNSGARVTHPDDPSGFYVHKPYANEWHWVLKKEGRDEVNLALRYTTSDGVRRGIVGDAMGILRKCFKDRAKQEAVLFDVLLDGKHVIYPGRVEIVEA